MCFFKCGVCELQLKIADFMNTILQWKSLSNVNETSHLGNKRFEVLLILKFSFNFRINWIAIETTDRNCLNIIQIRN